MDLYFQGMSAYNRGLTPDRLSEARRLFERALALDPNNVDAIVGAARTESAFAWAYRQVKGRLDLKAVDLGATQLKNIAEPIHVYSVDVGHPAPTTPASPPPEKARPPRLSIVVLPFANIGGDPEQEYFVDGVTESLTTDLSQMSGMRVIGRNTAFSYKAKAVDLKQIGRELNIRYVLEGSVQRSTNRIRVNVQLIDAESGDHLWAERFDKTVADLFDMQDEIVARLANALNAQLIIAEARRAAALSIAACDARRAATGSGCGAFGNRGPAGEAAGSQLSLRGRGERGVAPARTGLEQPARCGEGRHDRRDATDALRRFRRSDVDAVAHEIAVALLDDVAEMDADAEFDPPLRRHTGVALDEAGLHLDRAAHRVDHAAELDDAAVPPSRDTGRRCRAMSQVTLSAGSRTASSREPSPARGSRPRCRSDRRIAGRPWS